MKNFTRLIFKNWLFAALILSCCTVNVEAQLLNESFDGTTFPPAGWSNFYIHGSPSYLWARYPGSSSSFIPPSTHSGLGEAFVWNYADIYPATIVLATPALQLQNYSNGYALVSLWIYRWNASYTGSYGLNNDKLSVYVNTTQNMNGSPTFLGAMSNYINPGTFFPASLAVTTAGWYQYSFPIPTSYNGAPAYVLFQDSSNYGYDMYIDDVTVNWIGPCSGTPAASTIGSTPIGAAICPGTSFSLFATDPNVTTQITRIWQQGPTATGPWTNVTSGTGFNSLNYTSPGITDTTYFRMVDSCNVSGIKTPTTNTYKVPVIKYYLPYLETFNSTASNTSPACYVYNDNYGVNWKVVNGTHAADGTTMTAMSVNDPASNAAYGKNNFFTVPGFSLTGSQVYAVRFKYARGAQDAVNNVGNVYPEHLQVYASSPAPGFNVGNVTSGTLLFDQTITFNSVADTTLYFAPPTNGSYYFSWYSNTAHPGGATSTSAGGTLIVDSVYIAPSTCVAPAITNQPTSVSSCLGNPVSLSVTNTGTANTYIWQKNGATIPGATAATFSKSSVAYSDSGNYVVIITNPCGAVTSSSINLSVNPLPSTTVTPNGPTTFCAGTNFILQGPIGGGNSYQWYNGTTSVSGATSVNYSPTTSGTYSVTVTSAAGCTATSTGIAVTVNPLPNAVITPSGPTTFCNGDSVTLIASTGAGLSYQWYKNNNAIPGFFGGTNVSQTVKGGFGGGGGSYKVTVNNGTCSATSATTNVNVVNPPNAQIGPFGSLSFCTGSSITLTANTGAGLSYQWRLNGNNINDTTSTYVASSAGTYTVVVSQSGCSSTSFPKNVTAIPSPPAYVTASNPVVCAGSYVVLTADTATGYTYQWFKNGTSTGVTAYFDTVTSLGNYYVTITNSTNCSATSPITPITVHALPPANIAVTGSASACAGNTVTLTASAGNGYSYQWMNASGLIIGATGQYYNAGSTDVYKAIVTDLYGCNDTTTTGTAVTINAAPTINIVNLGSTSFCPGGSATLTASPGFGSGLTYLWYFNGANTGVTNPTFSATGSGSITVQATNSAGCSAISAPVLTTLNTAPPATIQANGPLNFCPGSNVILSTPTSATYTYLWKNKAGTVLSATSSYTATTTDSIDVKVTDQSTGCSATSSFGTTPYLGVTLNSAPAASAAATGATTICAGNSVTLAADTNSSAGISYQWKLNGSVLGGATAPTYTASTGGNYSVTTSNGSCTTTSSPINITVNPSPNPSITPLSNPIFCSNGYVSLSATTGAGYTYKWHRNGNPVSATGSTSPVFTTDTAGIYTVTVTNNLGCAGISAPVTLTVYAAPKVNLAALTSTTACKGDTVKFYAGSTSTGLAYKWFKGSTQIPSAITANFGATTSGTYSVIITNSNSCSDTSVAIPVTLNPTPTPVISQSGAVLSAGAYSSYQWYYNNHMITGARNSNYTVPQLGNYSVLVTDANGCSGMSAVYTVTNTTGVNNVNGVAEIKLYPNPTISVVYIESPIAVNAKISGLDGKMLIESRHATQIDLSELANGIYMISLYDDNSKLIKIEKLVKSGW